MGFNSAFKGLIQVWTGRGLSPTVTVGEE